VYPIKFFIILPVYTSAIVGGNVWFGGSFVTNTFLYSNPNAAALNGLAAWNGSQLFNAVLSMIFFARSTNPHRTGSSSQLH